MAGATGLAAMLFVGLVGSSVAADDAGAAAGQATAVEAPDTESGLPDDDLDRMVSALRDESVEGRRAAATTLCSLGPEGVPPIRRRLAALRRASDEGAASLLRAMHEKSPRGVGPELLDTLLAQPAAAPQLRALEMDCMLRALAHAGTTPAVRQMIGAASDLAGALRVEIGHLVRGLGERAIPALVESRRDPTPEVRSWAAGLLASIDKHGAEDALRVKDDRLLGDILHAYGVVSDMDALPQILPLANSDRSQVRAAARAAVLAYGQDAVWRLRESYAVLLGEQAPEGMPAADLARKLFEADDRYRLRDVYVFVDRGVALERDGKAPEAVALFDQALEREPLIERRPEMVRAYADLGASRETTDPVVARALLTKALRLDENGPSATHLRSELLRLEGEALASQGIDDLGPFEQALALEPGNRDAQADLRRLRAVPEAGHARPWRLIAAAVVLALAIAGLVVLGGRGRGGRR